MLGKAFRLGSKVSRYAMWAQLGLLAATYVASRIRNNANKSQQNADEAANLP